VAEAALKGREIMKRLSPANRRYLLRMFSFSVAYVLILFAVNWANQRGQLPEGPARYLLAAIPSLPVAGVIWSMMRFAEEEEDEYQRFLHNRALLAALGLTMGACVLWGLMQRYAGAAPVNLMDVFALFWVLQLLSSIWVQLRARA
jgi:hypothetical protein